MNSREEQVRTVAASILRLRTAAGMTQAELAEKLDYTTKAISKWECAESVPDVFVLKRLADLFGVTLDSLFGEEAGAGGGTRTSSGMGEDGCQPGAASAAAREPAGLLLFGRRLRMTLSQLCITALSVLCVWFLAVAAFVLLSWFAPAGGAYWLAFVAAVPASAVVLLVFNSVWGRRAINPVIIAVLVWTALAFVYLFLLCVCRKNAWLIFLLGVPLCAALPLWRVMEKNAEKRKNAAHRAAKSGTVPPGGDIPPAAPGKGTNESN